ncbi:MAG: YqiJ family protein [Scytolyngbya sp. HA4215-MV1]|jgi:hypothetical protein|nr:YqiJ family protein [Scytolyngbya sp. HA4215-MV1]
MLFNPVNLPYWIFLGVGVSLFLMVILSGGGDHDTHLDANTDVDIDGDSGDFHFGEMVSWLGFGRAPLILLLATDLSLWGLLGWMLNVGLGEAWGRVPNGFWVGMILTLSLGSALLLGSLIARPIGKVFAAFGEDTSSDRLIGCIGTVCSATIPITGDQRIGQVNVFDSARNLVTVNAILPEWATVFPRLGEKVLVIDRQAQNYIVIAKDSSDQTFWLNTATQTEI